MRLDTDHTRNIGIMGGTFNPIHYGHLIIAENAYEQFQLDQVLFMPTGKTPHKHYSGEEMATHRCEMVRLAIEGNDHFSLSTYEIEKMGVNYTYQTLAAIKTQYPDANLYFIMGADSLFGFEQWMCPAEICRQATILVAVRASMTEQRVDEQMKHLTELYQGSFYRVTSPNFSVSSKIIRERKAKKETIRYMLPEAVRAYIEAYSLYDI